MWKDKCHKCGRQIFNGIPDEFKNDIQGYISTMETEGYIIGYNTKIVGYLFGNPKENPIKPICKICSQEESDKKKEKETQDAMWKISRIIKKEFSCPICEYNQRRGNDIKIFKCSSKQEMINHIREKHNLSEMKDILPYEEDN